MSGVRNDHHRRHYHHLDHLRRHQVFCLFAGRRPIRDGDEWEKPGGQKSETSKQAPTRKTKAAAVDRRQNNRMLRQCPSGIAQRPPHYAIAVPTAVQNRQSHSHVRSSAVGKQLKQEKSNSLSLAQHHLPALGLFWASVFLRVQIPPVLLNSPGLD